MFTELGVHFSAISRKFPYGGPVSLAEFFGIFRLFELQN
jgi:hypothetical protein